MRPVIQAGTPVLEAAPLNLQSRVTHPHARAQVSRALCDLWTRYELEGRRDAWVAAYRRLIDLYSRPLRLTPQEGASLGAPGIEARRAPRACRCWNT